METGKREFLAGLLQLAWADGELADSEREMMADILVRLGYSADEVETEPVPDEASPLADLRRSLPDRNSRLEALRDLVAIAFADRELTLEEFDYLEKIASQLELSKQDLMEMVRDKIQTSDA